ncbi:MAG: phosphoadenosine phosphosulfate reductase family protein [Paludibacteraceae bacterium]|nr:phosphoadenosine phosphosulfate reductase family protein [Paludibacteraceae bacterium]
MYKIEWDPETGGVCLNSRITDKTLGISPRPVFWEELDLLKMVDFGWVYPHSEEPLLWACNKKYYYRGELVFEVKGANIYDSPVVLLEEGKDNLSIKPIDVELMLERCKNEMFIVESEAIEFIHDTYLQYASARKALKVAKSNELDFEAIVARQEKKTKKKMAIVKEDCESFDIVPLEEAEKQGKKVYKTTKIDVFLASFSGGKDSQVVLDLCTRAIPSTEFEVIYSDTGYELPPSLELYEEVQRYYKERFPDLKFSTARNHDSVLNYWDKIGTPSDKHRWCCAVMKTAPLYRMLKTKDNKQARVLTFDGVRAEESVRRSSYNRIGKGVKHDTVINASPILNWNSIEIFLYLFKYKLPINLAYRQGMTRVGCLICPFSSDWNDMISNTRYKDCLSPFLTRIEKSVVSSGVKDVDVYIKEGNWKRRAGGRDMKFSSHLLIKSTKPDLILEISNPQKDLLVWLTAVGKYSVINDTNGNRRGELKYKEKVYAFEIEKKDLTYRAKFYNTELEPILQGLLKRVFYKATYCVNCEVCEVECPSGALTILPEPNINRNKCVHCHKCLEFHDFGCISAASLATTGSNNLKNNNMKLISYNNFGMNGDWVEYFFMCRESYFEENTHGLHPKEQLPSFVKWLSQAGLIDEDKKISNLGMRLADLYTDMPDLVWQIIWINLSYNSPIAKWYKENVKWGTEFTQNDIEELVKNDYPDVSPKTVHNIVYALFRTFRESPIGESYQIINIDKQLYKKDCSEVIDKQTVLYSLYKYSDVKGIKSFRVEDFYDEYNLMGIYREFGISKSDLLKHLRSLNSDLNQYVIANLNMGLDNITLRDDVTLETIINSL